MDRKHLIAMIRALADSAGVDADDILGVKDAAAKREDPRTLYRAAMLRRTIDAATSWAKRRTMDDQQALFVRQLVVQTLTEIERHEFPEAKWINGGLLVVRSEVNEGVDEYGWYEQGVVTEGAKLLSNDADDLPLVDLTGAYNLGRAHTFGAAFRYTTQDVRKARFQGTFDLVQDKAARVRETLDRLVNDLIAFGDTEAGFDGISNAKGITVDTSSQAGWAAATGDQIEVAFREMWNAITVTTGAVETPNTFVTTQEIFTALSTKPRNTSAGDMTILKFLMQSYPQITKWDWTQENETMGDGGTAANLLYNRDARKVRGEMPLEPVSLPEEQHGRKFKVETEGRWGGLVVKRPKGILRTDGVG